MTERTEAEKVLNDIRKVLQKQEDGKELIIVAVDAKMDIWWSTKIQSFMLWYEEASGDVSHEDLVQVVYAMCKSMRVIGQEVENILEKLQGTLTRFEEAIANVGESGDSDKPKVS